MEFRRLFVLQKLSVRLAKTQISLGIHAVRSETLLSAWRKFGFLATHKAHNEDSDQTGGCPGWYESSLGAQPVQVIWLVLSCACSIHFENHLILHAKARF